MTNTFVFCIIELDEDEDEEKDQAEILQKSRKQSLLPTGNFFITLYMFDKNMTNTFVFCIIELDEDEDEE